MRLIISIIISLIILIIALTSRFILIERLFIFVVVLLFLSYLAAWFGTWRIKGRLIQPARYQQAGVTFPVKAVVENSGRLPKHFLTLNIKTSLLTPGKQNTLVSLGPRIHFDLSLPVTFYKRGHYKLGPLIASADDPFGLFHFKKKLDEKTEVLICPSTVELPFFTLASQQEFSLNRFNRELAESGSLVGGVRDYVPGDSLHRIHWRSTAHKGKLVVKEYDIESNEKVWIFLDLSKNNKFENGTESSEESSILISASILKKYCEDGQQVGMIAQGERYYYFQPRAGNLNMWPIMESMAMMKASGQVPMARIIARAHEQLDRNSIAVIITPCADNEFTDSIIRLKRRGLKVSVIMLDNHNLSGSNGPEKAAKLMRSFAIPTYLIRTGDNLAEALNIQKAM
jgi:uncharacterized protein (DUF58 family)